MTSLEMGCGSELFQIIFKPACITMLFIIVTYFNIVVVMCLYLLTN